MSAAKKTVPNNENQTANEAAAAGPSDQQHTVSKVRPYPFRVDLLRAEGTPPMPAFVQKMTEVGFLISIEATHFIKVGDHLIAKFEIPVLHIEYNEPVRVIKTYQGVDQYVAGKAVKTYMAELHFKTIQVTGRDKIKEFNRLIKQQKA